MSEYLSKESLRKGIEVLEIIEKALEGKGFSVSENGVKVVETGYHISDGTNSRWEITGRNFHLVIKEKVPASEENIAETSEIGR